jgi:uncharacterized membrane protein YccC
MPERLISIGRGRRRDIARAALQGAAAAAATYAAMRALGLSELFIGVLSAVYILHPSIGGTLSSARARLVSTVVGTAAGLATILALPEDFGRGVALALAVFIVSGMAAARPDWTYGLVAAVGVSLAYGEDALETAVARGVAIALGAGIGLLAAILVWPETARGRREKHLGRAIRAVRDRVDDAVAVAEGEGEGRADEIVPRYHREITLARETHRYSRFRGAGQEARLEALQRLSDAAIVVDRADAALSGEFSLVHDMAGEVRSARKCIVAALDRLLAEDAVPRAELAALDRTLAGLSERAVAEAGSPEALRARLALVFGLAEVRASLGPLAEAVAGGGG